MPMNPETLLKIKDYKGKQHPAKASLPPEANAWFKWYHHKHK